MALKLVRKKVRQHGHECIVRTETTSKDPWTDKQKTVVEVRRVPFSQEFDDDFEESSCLPQVVHGTSILASFMPHSFSEFITDTLHDASEFTFSNFNQKR